MRLEERTHKDVLSSTLRRTFSSMRSLLLVTASRSALLPYQVIVEE
jgi:hypothetical protein